MGSVVSCMISSIVHHLGEGRTAPVPAKGAGASASGSRAERVERLLKALMAA